MEAVEGGSLTFCGLINAYLQLLYIIDMGTAAETSNNKASDNTCHLCGITFASNDEKEEHMKLEHSEHKQPSGVS